MDGGQVVYIAEYAKTNYSKCKLCKTIIMNGLVRIAIVIEVSDNLTFCS